MEAEFSVICELNTEEQNGKTCCVFPKGHGSHWRTQYNILMQTTDLTLTVNPYSNDRLILPTKIIKSIGVIFC